MVDITNRYRACFNGPALPDVIDLPGGGRVVVGRL